MAKTIQEINERIKNEKAVVFTAEEIIPYVEEKGYKKAAREVDVVTTGTFSPMCSSGAFLNFGHSAPRMKIQNAWLNDVPAYGGLAACDVYIGATQIPDEDPANKIYPGRFKYGGGYVIEELIDGKDITLKATSYGTDCYPRKELQTTINIKDLNQAYLVNPRNAYQNYNVAVNLSSRVIYTYLGVLQPGMGNANFSSAGQLSPLLNDPYYRTIGIGTRIFLGGSVGYVIWEGTQHNPTARRGKTGVPTEGAGTISVAGDMKNMSTRYVKGVSMLGYGVSLSMGIGIPIPIIDEEMISFVSIKDEDIYAPVIDYSSSYPKRENDILTELNYRDLRSGVATIREEKVPTASISSYPMAREIAQTLKNWIATGKFQLTEKVAPLPGVESGQTFKSLEIQDVP
ncbi:MAG: homocysteine biosynthesis protein [Spirochaetes bacterium]|nr:homocysteine biosynthesis protein [Spirochaetota bacterium]